MTTKENVRKHVSLWAERNFSKVIFSMVRVLESHQSRFNVGFDIFPKVAARGKEMKRKTLSCPNLCFFGETFYTMFVFGTDTSFLVQQNFIRPYFDVRAGEL